MGDLTVLCAKADHGELSPDALALTLDFGGTSVMFTGDTAFNIDLLQPLIDLRPDVLIPCINGAFCNMNAIEAAELTAIVRPKLAIPCHFWMFKEQNGDPEAYFQACKELCPSVDVRFLTPGEGLTIG
jgi:L-ascorbate 6-phosphate lactonase